MALLGVLVLAGAGWAVSVAVAASAPPAPSVTASPSTSPTNSTSITFNYSDSQSGVTFTCTLDNIAKTCSGTKSGSVTFSSLPPGSHTFAIKAVSGSTSSSATSYTWTIDTTPPTATGIVRAGPSPTSASSVSWTVSFSEAVTGVASGNFSLVESGLTGTPSISNVSGSGSTWTVTASDGSGTPSDGSAGTLQLNLSNKAGIADPAGNALSNTLNGTSASLYQIDKFTPAPAFTSKPPDPNGTATSTFVWTEQEPGDTYLCSVENGKFASTVPSVGGSPQPCSSPLTYNVDTSNSGVHQFAVEAVDALGNVSSSISWSWKVDKGSQALSVSGNAGTVYPAGVASSFQTTITNPNSTPVTITSLTVSLGAMPSGCQAGWFAISQSNVSASQPITVPANSSVTLPDAAHAPGVTAPTVSMADNGDQSGCENSTIPVSYDGTYAASFKVGAPIHPFKVAIAAATGGALMPTARNSANKIVDTVQVTITNIDPGAEFLHQLVYEITPGWNATLAGHPACTAADFSVGGEAVGAAHTQAYTDDIPPGGHVTHTVTLQMIDNGHDQDACSGAVVNLTVLAS